MERTVVVLGAKGRFGRHAVEAFHANGWRVIAAGRTLEAAQLPKGVTLKTVDTMSKASTVAACEGADVIVNAAHPPYTDWVKAMPTMTANVIAAAQASGATVMIPGNVYNYGASMPPVLTETTPHVPTTGKGKVRVAMEQSFQAANGFQTIVLRGGDFIEGRDTGNWFETYMTNALAKGAFTYPGRTDAAHAWAYLPDMARAMAQLAEKRAELPQFAEFGFAGLCLTGAEMQAAIERQIGRPLKLKRMPWAVLKLLGLVQPLMREVVEMRYLWDLPHRIDGGKLSAALPEFVPTPTDKIIARAIAHSEVPVAA